MDNEKINVFISSSMLKEGNLKWLEVRKNVYNAVKQNDLFHVYKIEDHASAEPSDTYFLDELYQSNIIIMLIGDVIKKGTYIEYVHALKWKKPMLIYINGFSTNSDHLKSTSRIEMSSKEFLTELIKSDPSTFRKVDDIAKLDAKDVYRDLLDAVRSGFLKHSNVSSRDLNVPNLLAEFKSNLQSGKEFLSNLILNNEVADNVSSVLKKSIISILIGSDLPSLDEYNEIIKTNKILYGMKDILSKRWEALLSNSAGEYTEAFNFEKEALEKAQSQESFPDWIINDIIIDCRNMAFNAGLFKEYNEFQDKIEAKKTVIHPFLDGRKAEVLGKLMNEMENFKLESPSTVHFGTALPKLLCEIQSLISYTLTFSASTSFIEARYLLADTLQQYATVAKIKNSQMLLIAVKVYFLNGNYDKATSLVDKHWSMLSAVFIQQVNETFKIFKGSKIRNRMSGEIQYISHWGGLLSNSNVREGIRNVLVALQNDQIKDPMELGNALVMMAKRFDPNDLLDCLKMVLNKNLILIFGKIPFLLSTYSIGRYDREELKEVLRASMSKILQIKDLGGNIALLLKFVSQNSLLSLKESNDYVKILKVNAKTEEIAFEKYSNNQEEYSLNNYIIDVKSIIEKWIDKSNKNGKLSFSGQNPVYYFNRILDGDQISSEQVEKIAEAIVPLIKKGLSSRNEDVIEKLFQCAFLVLKQSLLYGFAFPDGVDQISKLTLPHLEPHFLNGLQTINNIREMFEVIQSMNSNDDSLWLVLLTRKSVLATESYTLKMLQELNSKGELKKESIMLCREWLSSNSPKVVIAIMPVAMKWTLRVNRSDLMDELIKIRLSPYFEVRASLAVWLKRFKINTDNFHHLKNNMQQDRDWRIRNYISNINQ